MAGKSRSKPKRASGAASSDRLATAAAHAPMSGMGTVHHTVEMVEKIGKADADRLRSHKGNVLLEDVKPGQRVYLNVSNILGRQFLFEPEVGHLKDQLDEFLPDSNTNKENLVIFYSQLRAKVLAFDPRQIYRNAGNDANYKQAQQFFTDCEILAVLHHLCFGEPIPLIDVDEPFEDTPRKADETSSTKVRKIGNQHTTSTSKADETSRRGKSTSVESWVESSEDVKRLAPSIITMGSTKHVCACFPQDLRTPYRLVMGLQYILKVEGWLVTSRAFVMKAVDYFKHRLESDKVSIQQEYREAFKACNDFISQEGENRSDDEWRQFITNCVHLFALRHVLYDKPLIGFARGDSKEVDDMLEDLLHNIDTLEYIRYEEEVEARKDTRMSSTSSLGIQLDVEDDDDECKPDNDGASFDELENMEDITVYVEDCTGLPITFITNGTALKSMQQRAKHLCQDLAAAKLFYAELTKSCRKSMQELKKMNDMAKIGIPQAVEEVQSWTQDCLYWCVLRKVLHNVAVPIRLGRCGIPVDAGVKLPGMDCVSRVHM